MTKYELYELEYMDNKLKRVVEMQKDYNLKLKLLIEKPKKLNNLYLDLPYDCNEIIMKQVRFLRKEERIKEYLNNAKNRIKCCIWSDIGENLERIEKKTKGNDIIYYFNEIKTKFAINRLSDLTEQGVYSLSHSMHFETNDNYVFKDYDINKKNSKIKELNKEIKEMYNVMYLKFTIICNNLTTNYNNTYFNANEDAHNCMENNNIHCPQWYITLKNNKRFSRKGIEQLVEWCDLNIEYYWELIK